MFKNLRSLRWVKKLYYTSNDVIFDISDSKKPVDLDECRTYLIDIENAPDFIKKAKDGTSLTINDYPEIFVNNVPYIKLEFLAPNGNNLEYYFPLQNYIEKGDKIINGKAVQAYPNVFENRYIHKFNDDVYNFIKALVKDKDIFSIFDNIDYIMDKLPDWLTREINMQYMTKDYIETEFFKGHHYDKNAATKNSKNPNVDTYHFIGAFLGIGNDPITGTYGNINIWQRENIEKVLKAINAEKFVNKYNNFVKNTFNALSKDAMENIANTIKSAELGFNKNSLKTFINDQYSNHDCIDVNFESVSVPDYIDTWYEYLKRKDETQPMIFEEILESDKAYIEQYIQKNFKNPDEVSKYWWESSFTMDKYFTDQNAHENKINSIINIFSVGVNIDSTNNEIKNNVIMIYHENDITNITEHKNAIWTGDNNLYERTDQIVKTFEQAYKLMYDSEYDKIESRQCVLRATLGPSGATTPPQFIFGNIHNQIYVDAMTGTVLNYNPAFPPIEPVGLNGTLEDIRAQHKQLVNNRYGKNDWCETTGSFMTFIDDIEFDTSKLYNVVNIFKTENTYIQVYEDMEDGQSLTLLEDVTYETMPNTEIISLIDAVNIILADYNLPHSEHFSLINDNGTPKYKFGQDANAIIVNAITGEVEN